LNQLGGMFGIASSLPAPALGQHSDELLAALGHDNAAIAALRAAGVI
jgi:crotonobetainyl-CoA:carnitine CoA-transferase CaiB-like acyl-CoA transferase